jgi:hypothetical protein
MIGDSSPSPIRIHAVHREKFPLKNLFSGGSLMLNIEKIREMLALVAL